VGNACPWCHRVLLALAVRGLAGTISITHLLDEPERATRGGWIMGKPEPVFGAKDLWYVGRHCTAATTLYIRLASVGTACSVTHNSHDQLQQGLLEPRCN
jgi:glutathionyl-hydroquinone reductase